MALAFGCLRDKGQPLGRCKQVRCTATSSSLLLGQDITIAPLMVPQP